MADTQQEKNVVAVENVVNKCVDTIKGSGQTKFEERERKVEVLIKMLIFDLS